MCFICPSVLYSPVVGQYSTLVLTMENKAHLGTLMSMASYNKGLEMTIVGPQLSVVRCTG